MFKTNSKHFQSALCELLRPQYSFLWIRNVAINTLAPCLFTFIQWQFSILQHSSQASAHEQYRYNIDRTRELFYLNDRFRCCTEWLEKLSVEIVELPVLVYTNNRCSSFRPYLPCIIIIRTITYLKLCVYFSTSHNSRTK